MPTWLVHGFRWPRPLIRIHVILQNLEGATEGWLMAPLTTAALIDSFHEMYPDQMRLLPSLRFIEQHNPNDPVSTEQEQPYAFVCDQVHEIELSVDVDELRGKGVANESWAALADLRDKIAPGEKIGWFVVVNRDVERWMPTSDGADEGTASTNGSQTSPNSQRSSARTELTSTDSDQTQREPKGLRKWFSARSRSARSSKDLRGQTKADKNAAASPQAPEAPRNVVPPVPSQKAKAPVPGYTNGKGKGKAPVQTDQTEEKE